MKKFIVFVCVLMLALSACAEGLHVEGTRLVDDSGAPVQFRGVSTHGLSWFPQYVNQECFDQLAEWGATAVRLAMYTAEYAGYCTGGDKEGLKQLLRDGVSYAKSAGLAVIVDWHILSDNDPTIHQSEAVDFFDEMTREFGDSVIYEICNEPNSGTSWAKVKAYAETVIPVIRANAPNALILVGTPNWCQFVVDAAKDPLEFDNVMYTLHFYAATHKEDLRRSAQQALDMGLPLFVSEFGICDASGNGAIDFDQADKWIEFLDENGISYFMWSLCNKDESASMLKPGCAKVSGFEDDDLRDSGRWIKEVLGRGEAPVAPGEPKPKATTGPTPAPTAEPQINADGLELAIACVNSWEANGMTYKQFNLTITNHGAARENWTVALTSTADFELSDSWNGEYSADGRTLVISNASYNGSISGGGSVGDIGFILYSADAGFEME